MSAGRMKKEVADLAEEIAKAFEELQINDLQETQQFGEKSSDELPEELSRKQARLEKLNHALTELEQRATAKGKELDPKDQYNFTDPESRIMTTRKDGPQQCYNHQIIVDSQERVISAYSTSQTSNDIEQLKPTLTESKANTGKNPEKLTADTGYFVYVFFIPDWRSQVVPIKANVPDQKLEIERYRETALTLSASKCELNFRMNQEERYTVTVRNFLNLFLGKSSNSKLSISI